MTVEDAFAVTASRLVDRDAGVELGRMMRSTGLKAGGRFFAFARDGELVVKLPAGRVAALVESGEGGPFVGSRERVMREWVTLRPRGIEACEAYVAEALAFAGGASRSSTTTGISRSVRAW